MARLDHDADQVSPADPPTDSATTIATVGDGESPDGVLHELAAQVYEAQAEMSAAEAAMATVEARVGLLGARISSLRAVAHRAGLLRPKVVEPPAAVPVPAPVVDEAARARARRLLARSGFVRVTP